jgi:hypothetical protein
MSASIGRFCPEIVFLLADIDLPIPRPSKIVSMLLNEVARSELEFLKQASLVGIKVRLDSSGHEK